MTHLKLITSNSQLPELGHQIVLLWDTLQPRRCQINSFDLHSTHTLFYSSLSLWGWLIWVITMEFHDCWPSLVVWMGHSRSRLQRPRRERPEKWLTRFPSVRLTHFFCVPWKEVSRPLSHWTLAHSQLYETLLFLAGSKGVGDIWASVSSCNLFHRLLCLSSLY